MSEKIDVYWNIDDRSSSGYSSSAGEGARSHASESVLREDFYLSVVPEVPRSRPPAHSFSSYFSDYKTSQQVSENFDS